MANNLTKLIESIIDQKQSNIAKFDKLTDIFDIDIATGEHLKNINTLIGGFNSPNITDTELRIRIKAKIDINKGSGSYESLANAVRYYLYLNGSNTWNSVKDLSVAIDSSNGNINVVVVNSEINRDNAKRIVEFVPAGVGLYVIYRPTPYFGFADDVNAAGFDSGAPFAEIIRIN